MFIPYSTVEDQYRRRGTLSACKVIRAHIRSLQPEVIARELKALADQEERLNLARAVAPVEIHDEVEDEGDAEEEEVEESEDSDFEENCFEEEFQNSMSHDLVKFVSTSIPANSTCFREAA